MMIRCRLTTTQQSPHDWSLVQVYKSGIGEAISSIVTSSRNVEFQQRMMTSIGCQSVCSPNIVVFNDAFTVRCESNPIARHSCSPCLICLQVFDFGTMISALLQQCPEPGVEKYTIAFPPSECQTFKLELSDTPREDSAPTTNCARKFSVRDQQKRRKATSVGVTSACAELPSEIPAPPPTFSPSIADIR